MPLLTDSVQLWRHADGRYEFEWQTSNPETRVTLELLEAADNLQPSIEYHSSGAAINGLATGKRHRFSLTDNSGQQLQLLERKLGFRGTPNFRDFGGYRNRDGEQVKWGYLYRSGHLAALDDADVEFLDALQLDLVFDFREQSEQSNDPNRLPPNKTPTTVSLPISPGNNSKLLEQFQLELSGPQAMFDFMLEVNRELVIHHSHSYKHMFEQILNRDNARYLVHCAAGKDRTGFAAAMMLSVLGVKDELILRDYLLSSRFYRPEEQLARAQRKYRLEHAAADAIRPMLEVHAEYLAAALAAIDSKYGDRQSYLRDVLKLGEPELAELRRRYLEPA